MKRILIPLILILTTPAFAATWYVNVNGANRDNPSNGVWGGCDGTVNQSYVAAGAPTPFVPWKELQTVSLGYTIGIAGYSGATGYYWTVTTAGTTQAVAGTSGLFSGSGPVTDGTVTWTRGSALPRGLHCAFNEVPFFWSDGTYNLGSGAGWTWIGSGSDTYKIIGAISDGISYGEGYRYASAYSDPNGWWGSAGDPYGSGMPTPPSGSSGNPTIIEGGNAGSCTAQTSRTQLHGRWGVLNIINLVGSSYVTVSCLDLTDFSNCGRSSDYVTCDSTQDYAQRGLQLSNTTTHLTVTDVRIHGLAVSGIIGPPGDSTVMTDIAIVGNASAGWDADKGDGTTGEGSLLVQNYDISWNGCVEEYPIVDPLPYFSCRDNGTGGYGDGFGTASVDSSPPGWQVHFDQGTVGYNTQDGLDALHIGGTGSTMTVTRTNAYSNQGQQIKVGGATGTIQNSIIVGNCAALTTQVIPGRPVPTHDSLGEPCRAGNTGIVISVSPGLTTAFQDNTIYTDGLIALQTIYETGDHGTTNSLLYNNNIFYGFLNTGAGDYPTPIYPDDFNMLTNPGSSWTHNSYFQWKSSWTCPASGESSALCVDPQLTTSAYPAYGTVASAVPLPGSPVIHTGVNPPNLTVDFSGAGRPNPPSIGALEPTATAATPTFSPVAGTYTGTQSVTISTSTGGATLCYTVDGTTPTANGSGTCTHGTTYSTAVSVAASLTLKAVASESGYLDSGVGSAAYVINSALRIQMQGTWTLGGQGQ